MVAFIRKIILVIILTSLIWVWADKAMTDVRSNVPATIHIDKSTDPLLWIMLNKQTMASVNLKLSGPSAKIDLLDKQLKERGTMGFDFYFSPAEEKIASPGTWSLALGPLVQKSKLIQDLGLTVESCQPESVPVEVVKLAKRKLSVQVLNENKMPMTCESLDPAIIEMPVPENWTGDALKSTIVLTQQEIEQSAPIYRKPVVELGAGITRPSDDMVKITLPSTASKLEDLTIDAPTLGITSNLAMQGAYKVEITNLVQISSPLKIRATPEAKAAYDRLPFNMRLNILESDKGKPEAERELICNLPEEYVRSGEIAVDETTKRIAKFKLIERSTAEKTASIGELPATTPLPKVFN